MLGEERDRGRAAEQPGALALEQTDAPAVIVQTAELLTDSGQPLLDATEGSHHLVARAGVG